MARVALIGDSHFDEHSRFDECVRLHDWIASDMAARGVSLVLHSGDVYERRSTPKERAAVADWCRRVTEYAELVIVRGNHDQLGDLQLLDRLNTRHRITVVEGAGVLHFAALSVACIAWPRLGELRARDPDANPADALRNLFRGLAAELGAFDVPKLALMHAMVRGSRVSTGQPLMGCDLEIGLEDIALLRADAYCLGHVHKQQDWEIAGAPVIYPGSPRRTAFGETERKGYVVIDPDASPLDWEFVETPATPMVLLEGRWQDGQLVGLEHESLMGAEVRLRYHAPSEHREAARAKAGAWAQRCLDAGAVSVVQEEVVTTETRARAPEVAVAPSLTEQLEAYWASVAFDPGARREALVGKLSEVSDAT